MYLLLHCSLYRGLIWRLEETNPGVTRSSVLLRLRDRAANYAGYYGLGNFTTLSSRRGCQRLKYWRVFNSNKIDLRLNH